MKILDIWGEGRIVDNISDTVFVTGFTDADNINKDDQKISNGPNAGKEIPRLIPVKDYDYPIFPLAEDLYPCETLMGAPITVGAAQEMCRVLSEPDGKVYLYDPAEPFRKAFETTAHAHGLSLEGRYSPQELPSPLNEITMHAVYVYVHITEPATHPHTEL
ncbi:hypothetical protein GCM10009504_46430 [Pseudomonas laurentiana]|uniref:hypothetical protein n=1 Tax=Pseudomonas laurentiana TaxID=2364649 RepID=UPI001672BA81|nr:hypothetical protein [Pseudomonas laurentiana]GGU84824.1 hypothetical protein GCM10009504_46430 [Pseudomonas laurentiana]